MRRHALTSRQCALEVLYYRSRDERNGLSARLGVARKPESGPCRPGQSSDRSGHGNIGKDSCDVFIASDTKRPAILTRDCLFTRSQDHHNFPRVERDLSQLQQFADTLLGRTKRYRTIGSQNAASRLLAEQGFDTTRYAVESAHQLFPQ